MKIRSVAPGVTPEGFVPGSALDRRAGGDIAVRFAPASYNAEARTIRAVASSGARVRRWGIFEELSISPEAIDLARVAPGQVKLLDSHDQGSIDRILGTVTRAWIEGGSLMVEIRFADTEAGRAAEARAQSPDAPGLSVGYRVTTWTLTQVENDSEIWRADRWELLEVSLVAVPADPAALFRAAQTSTPETLETDDMRRNAPADAPAPTPITTPAAAQPAAAAPIETRAAPAAPVQPSAADLQRGATERATQIMEIGERAGMDGVAVRAAVANTALTVEAFRAHAFDALVARQTPTSHIRIERDETETRRLGMEEALTRGINPASMQGEWSEAAVQYRGFSLVEMAAERLGERRVAPTFGAREEVLRRAMHTTSDFPLLLENSVNRNLTASYVLAVPTYREISVREDFNDFRPHTAVTVGDFPLLQPIAEAGNIKFGTIGENKEQVAIVPYAVGLAFSRQLLVNDNLNGLARVIANYGQSVALFEEKTAYAVKALNSGAGPNLIEAPAGAMFAAGRGNLAGSGGAISVATVGAARVAMRGYKSIDGNELLYNAPRILLIGPAKETEAEQFLATITPSTNANVVPESMRSLRPVVSQMITGNSWELYTETSVRANFRWGLLNGYEAPRVRVEVPFGSQGTQMSVEHDFGFGGINWRAGYRNPGN
ncbi:HK97 family phage prohead protease [Bosea sp. BK604]|uniref:phage major capsid protein n=1 Tax=Bosea sp. BK604 TaxID=2512180 RepID=UPI001045DB05|nr:HK97 family phage prohead protease [Bosea sp. BK604]TCR69699.1 HK97 family phage prohead protease [Bosea sp. BK604]